jgi:hypothetical protein
MHTLTPLSTGLRGGNELLNTLVQRLRETIAGPVSAAVAQAVRGTLRRRLSVLRRRPREQDNFDQLFERRQRLRSLWWPAGEDGSP